MPRSTRTQAEFLSELEQFVVREGLANWTISEIAARLKCSRRRIYDLASNKDELFLLIARRVFSILLEKCQRAAQSKTDVASAVYAHLTTGITEGAQLGIPYLTELEGSDRGRRLFDEYQEARSQGMVQLLEEGISAGQFRYFHASLVTEAILGAAQRIRRPGFLLENGLTGEQAFRELYRLILDGLLAEDRSLHSKSASTGGRKNQRRVKAGQSPGIK